MIQKHKITATEKTGTQVSARSSREVLAASNAKKKATNQERKTASRMADGGTGGWGRWRWWVWPCHGQVIPTRSTLLYVSTATASVLGVVYKHTGLVRVLPKRPAETQDRSHPRIYTHFYSLGRSLVRLTYLPKQPPGPVCLIWAVIGLY